MCWIRNKSCSTGPFCAFTLRLSCDVALRVHAHPTTTPAAVSLQQIPQGGTGKRACASPVACSLQPRGADTHAVAMRARLSRSPRARLRHLVAGLNHLPRLVYAWEAAPISPPTEIIVRSGGTIRHFSTQEMLKCNCAALSRGITEDGGAEHGNHSRHDVTGVLDVGPLLSPATRARVVLPSRSACCVSLFMFACKNRVGSWRKDEGGGIRGGWWRGLKRKWEGTSKSAKPISPRVKISPTGNLPLRYLTELFD